MSNPKTQFKPIKVNVPHNRGRSERIERYWDNQRKIWVNVTMFTY